jgi:hypothetical protein
VLCVSVFFIGLGNLIERASASFKSDDKALELLSKARAAIGGDAAIGGVRSMTITGRATKTFEVEGAARTENGELEINFELPNKLNRHLKLGSGEGDQLIDKQVDVFVMRKGDGDNVQLRTAPPENGDGLRKVTIVKKDGSSEEVKIGDREPVSIRRGDGQTVLTEDGRTANVDGKKIVIRKADGPVGAGEFRRTNELFRTTLSLLLTAPEGVDVSYTYVGEGTVDGAACDIVAANDGGSVINLYLDKSTSLPRMISYQGHKPFVIRFNKGDAKTTDRETRILERLPAAPEMAEFQIKFSDFRAVNGLQLPFRWTQTVGGKDDEAIDVTAYDINPANIADKFKESERKVFVRKMKEQ